MKPPQNALHGPFELPAPPRTMRSSLGKSKRRSEKATILRRIEAGECYCSLCGDDPKGLPKVGYFKKNLRANRYLTARWCWLRSGEHTWIIARES